MKKVNSTKFPLRGNSKTTMAFCESFAQSQTLAESEILQKHTHTDAFAPKSSSEELCKWPSMAQGSMTQGQ